MFSAEMQKWIRWTQWQGSKSDYNRTCSSHIQMRNTSPRVMSDPYLVADSNNSPGLFGGKLVACATIRGES